MATTLKNNSSSTVGVPGSLHAAATSLTTGATTTSSLSVAEVEALLAGDHTLSVYDSVSPTGAPATVVCSPVVCIPPDAQTITNPAAADLVSVVNTVALANGVLTILAPQMDVPRKLQVRIIDANSSITAGTLTLVAVNKHGAVSQVINLAGGTRTVLTDFPYAGLMSATVAGLAGATGADTVSIGLSNALGLDSLMQAAHTFVLDEVVVDGSPDGGVIDATAGTFTPTTLPDGAHDYAVRYHYSFTPTTVAHSHGG